MTDKELRRLKREELLEMLVEQEKEVENLRSQLEDVQQKLEDREITLSHAGNIAEASLQINGVFEAAQAAAQQYLENIQRLSERQEVVCIAMEQSMKEKCAAMEKETEEKCQAMHQQAQKEVDERWSRLSERLEEFYNAHKGLRELVAATGEIQIE